MADTTVFGLLALRKAIQLEAKGIEFKPSKLSMAKKQLGLKGNRNSIINQLEAMAHARAKR
tara:strand:+ start:436 stop:618 length:183 start_codon:yes stop_codon:yes gene_type:complete